MPIGKDSIQKRVAKATEAAPAEEVKVEVVAETAPAQKPAVKKATTTKSTSTGAKKSTSTGAKKAPAKKPATKVATTTKEDKPAVDTAVLSNVSPETVAAVIGHDENKPSDKVKIGQKMPTYLL
ncbi:MAG: hypothetical protein E7661_06555 [Ruminococcaceae bacterium]|nr:hypothetical protein [Oscillospiraceae bacterium]